MKRYLFASMVLGSVGAAAQAQSSVTLYGLTDAGLVASSNAGGGRVYKVASGNMQGDRWGMRGVEDLGGGWHAIFRLEGGYDITSGALGQGGALFGREATVGLGGKLGDVTVGRQYDSLTTFIGPYTAGDWYGNNSVGGWASVYGVHPGDIDNLGGSNRINNSVKFKSTNFGGFEVGGSYSLGGVTGEPSQNQVYSLSLSYAIDGFNGAVSYLNARDPNYSYFGDKPSSNTATSPSALNMTSPVYSGFASAHTAQVIAAGGAYIIGNATIGVEYDNMQFKDLSYEKGAGLNPLGLTGTAQFNIAEVSVAYRITPAFQVGVDYARTSGNSVGKVGGATYNQIDLAADYALSKRSDIYLVWVGQRASGVDSTGKSAVAAIANLTASNSANQMMVTAGIRHRF